MHMKKILLLFFSLFLTGVVLGDIVELPDVLNPNPVFYPLQVDKDHIYVTDGFTIYIYSADDYTLINSFGKQGEGPQEFKLHDYCCVYTYITSNHIVVTSTKKISLFTRDGTFKKEMKAISGYFHKPLGDKMEKFVAYAPIEQPKKYEGAFFIFDSNFKKLKELCRFTEYLYQEKFNPFLYRKPFSIYYDNKIFINNFDEGSINVHDENGNKLYTITYNYEKVKVTDAHKNETLETFKADPRIKDQFQVFKQRIVFPKFLPAMKQYNISDDKIYILTYRIQNNKSEFIVLDLKGKFLRKMMMPLAHLNFSEPSPYTIFDGRLYQLVENPKTERWDLHITNIE